MKPHISIASKAGKVITTTGFRAYDHCINSFIGCQYSCHYCYCRFFINGPAAGLYSTNNQIKSYNVPFDQIDKLELKGIKIYPSVAYHGAAARNYFNLFNVGSQKIAQELVKLPFWPDVIYKKSNPGNFKWSEDDDYDNYEYELS